MNLSLIILLAASYIFYAILDLRALPVLIGMSLFTYLCGKILFARKKSGVDTRRLTIVFIAIQTAVLCFFKYSGTFPLPVGMSFYMLMAISFLVDISNGAFEAMPSLPETLAYVSFFPTVISGPIMKAHELIPQFSARQRLTKQRFENGIWMITFGIFMKLVMADRLAAAVDKVYQTPLVYSGLTLFLTSVGYTLQLLFDFAGYSYMATGVAGIIGYDIIKNFNLPYIATDPSEFWKRWHISLSSWLKEYVYIPLGGSRKGNFRTYLNIMIVMTVSGLWHGSTVNFLIWGIMHGLLQVIYRLISSAVKKDAPGKAVRTFMMILNFLLINFLWIPFRMPTLAGAWTVFVRIITFAQGASYYYIYTFIFGIMLLAVQFYGIRKCSGNDPLKPLPFERMYAKVIFCMLLIATAMFAYFGSGAFIYAQF